MLITHIEPGNQFIFTKFILFFFILQSLIFFLLFGTLLTGLFLVFKFVKIHIILFDLVAEITVPVFKLVILIQLEECRDAFVGCTFEGMRICEFDGSQTKHSLLVLLFDSDRKAIVLLNSIEQREEFIIDE